MNYSERRTESHVYFLGGPLSQWYKSNFDAVAFPSYSMAKFSSAEQYMMASKALLFRDEKSYNLILETDNPRTQKQIGRQVKNFDEAIWKCCAKELVLRGNIAKFDQNIDLRKYLLETDNLILVEGAAYDKVWGVGLAYDSKEIEDVSNWNGQNWLGRVLMEVRRRIRLSA